MEAVNVKSVRGFGGGNIGLGRLRQEHGKEDNFHTGTVVCESNA